jgi:hypothetical protein
VVRLAPEDQQFGMRRRAARSIAGALTSLSLGTLSSRTGVSTASSAPGRASAATEASAARTQPQLPGPVAISGRASRHHSSSA